MKPRTIIDQVPFLTLASVDSAGQPWSTPLAYSYDPRGYIYWRSGQDSQHSRNVRANQRVFITIFQTVEQPGLYLLATAEEISDMSEVEHALALDRHPKFAEAPSAYQGDHPRRYYRARILKAWVNADDEESGSFVDIRHEVPLSELTGDAA
jgi:hypothetical protein